MKNPQTLAGIEPATFRFVAQHLNHCAIAAPNNNNNNMLNSDCVYVSREHQTINIDLSQCCSLLILSTYIIHNYTIFLIFLTCLHEYLNLFMFSCVAAAQRGPWSPHAWDFQITHNDAPQSVGLLRTSDQLVAETSTWQHITLTTDRHAWLRRGSNPQSLQGSIGRLTPETAWPLGPALSLFTSALFVSHALHLHSCPPIIFCPNINSQFACQIPALLNEVG